MPLIGDIVLAAVVAQLLATLAFQFAPLRSRLVRLDYIGALPRWRFFIPDGGSHDHAIAVRERTAPADGGVGEWRTLWEMPPRGRWAWLWAPDPCDDQNLWFAVATLDARIMAGKGSSPDTSQSHALILNRCRQLLGAGASDKEHEFALLRIEANGERRIGFSAPVDRS